MTRKEQTEEYAMTWLATVYGKNPVDYFVAGAEWADLNPDNQKIWDLIEDHKVMKQALAFYENMDNRVPGTTTWPKEVIDVVESINISMIAYNKPSKMDVDVGTIAREALSKLKVKP